jgi:bifunctional DNase/RNase
MALIPVTVTGVQVEQNTGAPVMLLREDEAPHRILPIFVGPAEARSISVAMAGLEPPRPGTHDLMVTTLQSMGSTLTEVDVTELRDGTFIAELVLHNDAGELRISGRPSDAVALAVRFGAPVFAADAVLAEAGIVEHDEEEPAAEAAVVELSQEEIDATVEQLEDFLASFEDPGDEPPTS